MDSPHNEEWASKEEATNLQLLRLAPLDSQTTLNEVCSAPARPETMSAKKRLRSPSQVGEESPPENGKGTVTPSLHTLNKDFSALQRQYEEMGRPVAESQVVTRRLSCSPSEGRNHTPPHSADAALHQRKNSRTTTTGSSPTGSNGLGRLLSAKVRTAGRVPSTHRDNLSPSGRYHRRHSRLGLQDPEDDVVDRLSRTAELSPRLEDALLPPRSVTPPAATEHRLRGRLSSLQSSMTNVGVPQHSRSPVNAVAAEGRRVTSNSPPMVRVSAGRTPSLVTQQEPTPPRSPRTPSAVNGKGRNGRIKVVVRKRPLSPGEPGKDCVEVQSPSVRLCVTRQRVDLSDYEESNTFSFDTVFDTTEHNESVYAGCVQELLEVVLGGGSASCFAYGQTGSGKTHTMMGAGEEKGLFLLAGTELCARVTPAHSLQVSFFEIYLNSLYDLLNHRFPVVLREDSNRRVNMCGLSWHPISSPSELLDIISKGMEQRMTGCTSANERSSRSHGILSIQVRSTVTPDVVGTMNFVDLAGSERAADTANNDKVTRMEGAEINKSLLALKECIRALDERKRHIPFRGSKLTEVLRDSFTGNSKTVMIATIAPGSANYDHTANTLRYAFRVKGLSVPSVQPSKARNAPRPFSVARSTTSPSTGDYSGIERVSPPRSGAHRASAAAAAAGGGRRGHRSRSRSRPRLVSKFGASPSPRRRSPAGEVPTIGGSCDVTVTDLSGAEEDESRLLQRRAVGVYSRHRSRPQRYSAGQLTVLLPNGVDRPLRNRGSVNVTANEDVDVECNPNSNSSPATPAATAFTLPQPSSEAVALSPETIAAVEERLRRDILRQLQRDLGNELQMVLDERDAMIAALKKENAKLRETVQRLQGVQPCSANGKSDAMDLSETDEYVTEL